MLIAWHLDKSKQTAVNIGRSEHLPVLNLLSPIASALKPQRNALLPWFRHLSLLDYCSTFLTAYLASPFH